MTWLLICDLTVSIYIMMSFQEKDPLPFTYFAIFDGHAGTGAALMAVKLLHEHIQVSRKIHKISVSEKTILHKLNE